jgi:hypothetical protein
LAAAFPAVTARRGMRVAHRASGFAGDLVDADAKEVVLRTPSGLARRYPNQPGAFLVDGTAVRIVAGTAETAVATPEHLRQARVSETEKTASGSRKVIGAKARVARASRILVEGIHDAQLVERVWGDDLRIEGVVVERLDGIDHLADVVREFEPGRSRRLGVLVDHLVPGSKEARIAKDVSNPYVLVTGTPYVDVWEAVRPKVVGIPAWPVIPKGQPWKEGVCAALGVGHPGEMWQRILGSVSSWTDLEQPMVRAVEELVDFVTVPSSGAERDE